VIQSYGYGASVAIRLQTVWQGPYRIVGVDETNQSDMAITGKQENTISEGQELVITEEQKLVISEEQKLVISEEQKLIVSETLNSVLSEKHESSHSIEKCPISLEKSSSIHPTLARLRKRGSIHLEKQNTTHSEGEGGGDELP
jgi:hypothetical protein